ncbi:hypothetical protein F4782DRAFT_533123 [Xylaria castorea]|nr:hypothetical protein F4782DRAFT_533123 [Xylaria castorea]
MLSIVSAREYLPRPRSTFDSQLVPGNGSGIVLCPTNRVIASFLTGYLLESDTYAISCWLTAAANKRPRRVQPDGRIAVVEWTAHASDGDSGSDSTPTDAAPTPTTTPNGATNVGIVSGIVLLVWTALLAVVVM